MNLYRLLYAVQMALYSLYSQIYIYDSYIKGFLTPRERKAIIDTMVSYR